MMISGDLCVSDFMILINPNTTKQPTFWSKGRIIQNLNINDM